MKVQWNDNTSEVKRAIHSALVTAISKAAVHVQGEAKMRVPVRTGNLKGSITQEVDGLTGTVGTNVEYAPFVEYGTVRQSPQPYLFPALDENKDNIRQMIREEIEKVTR